MTHSTGHFHFVPVFITLFLATALTGRAVERWVTNKSQFTATMSVVQPGDVIIWKNGTLTDQSSITFEPVAQGTAAQPITLRAESPGGVVFRGNTKLLIGGRHLVVSGFRFDNSDYTFSGTSTVSSVIDFRAHSTISRHAYNCRVTECTIVNYDNPAAADSSKWILMYGATNQFDHNYVSGKTSRGALLVVELNAPPNNVQAAHRINNNVFANRPPGPENEYETLRIGTSTVSDQNARVTVESNYFYRCCGEAEIVSNKSCENTYRHNTFVECEGSLTLRHGRGCLVDGNVFFGGNVTNSGGIRVVNQDHVIVNNYLQDLAGKDYQAALAIMDGTTPGVSNPDLSGGYVQVSNVVIAHNTFFNVKDAVNFGVGKGGAGRTQPPRDFTLAANIIVTTNAPVFTITDTPVNVTYSSNIVWGATLGLPANPGLIITNPALSADLLGIQRPATNSHAKGRANTQALLPGDLLDMDGSLRPLNGRDIGADQIDLGARPSAPLSPTEVGPSWMQTPLNPYLPPSGNFDLSHWKLTLPIDSNGTNVGNPVEKTPAQLVAGFTNGFFYTGADGAMVFWCPVDGTTTSGSSYPRSELRERINPTTDNVNWTGHGTHILDAVCKVTQVPATPKVIIGQIHSHSGDARPLIKLQYSSGTIEALYKFSPNSDTDTKYTFANVGLSNNIAYQIKLVNGQLDVTVNGNKQGTNIFLTDPDWANQTFYFKAGSYCQDNTGNSSEGARVAFYALTTTHITNTTAGPIITNQPTSQSVTAGSNVTFTVGASGTTPLNYRWRFNVTNNLPVATNASLTLTNVQTTNAGGYTVVITNAHGSVTSHVATLMVVATNEPPGITAQPTNQTVFVGQTASFTVLASGTQPLVYQWYFDGDTAWSNGTNATLFINNAQSNNAAGYFVVVTNSFGSITSEVATLTVNPPPPINTNAFQWDANTNVFGIQDGSGIWKANALSNSFWTTNGGVTDIPWPEANVPTSAVFGGGESGTAGIVTLVDPIGSAPTVNSITFNAPFAGDYIITNRAGAAGPVLNDGANITVNGGRPSIKSPLGGASATAGFTKLGAGTLALGAANTFSGVLTISEGTLVIGSDTALGANPASLVTNQLTLDGGTLRITNNVTWGTRRGIYLTTNGGTIDVIAGTTLTMAGGSSAPECISGAESGDLIKTGGGTFSIQIHSVANPNTYPGQTIVREGMLEIIGNNLVTAIGPGGLTIETNAVFAIAASKSGMLAAGISVTNMGGTFIAGGTETNANLVLGGNGIITNGSTSSRTFYITNAIILESGAIVGNGSPPIARLILAGPAGLLKTTPGVVYLVGTNSTQAGNTYTGKTTISDGVLNIGFDTALGANPGSFTADQLIFDGGTLQIMNAYTWGARRGVTLTANGGTFDILPGVTQTVPVAIVGTLNGALTKIGGGTLALSATNTFNGDTIINDGVLALAASGGITNSPVVSIVSGAVLDVSTAGITFGSIQTLAGSGMVTGNVIMSPGAKIRPGRDAQKLTISGNLTLNNNTVVVDLEGATLGAGVYRLIDYSGGRSGSFAATPVILNGSTAGAATIDESTANQINLIVEAAPASQPGFGSVIQSGTDMIMSGNGGTAGGTYRVLASTNIALPISNWVAVFTNQFDESGAFSFTNGIVPGVPWQFFLLTTP